MKQVTVYSTVGQNKKEVSTNASSWGELQNELTNVGVNVGGMKVVVGETQVTLESNGAVLPEGDFTLFLLPQKVKSGVIGSYWGSSSDDDDDDDDCGCNDDEDYSTPKGRLIAKLNELSGLLTDLYDLVGQMSEDGTTGNIDLQKKAEELQKNMGNLFS